MIQKLFLRLICFRWFVDCQINTCWNGNFLNRFHWLPLEILFCLVRCTNFSCAPSDLSSYTSPSPAIEDKLSSLMKLNTTVDGSGSRNITCVAGSGQKIEKDKNFVINHWCQTDRHRLFNKLMCWIRRHHYFYYFIIRFLLLFCVSCGWQQRIFLSFTQQRCSGMRIFVVCCLFFQKLLPRFKSVLVKYYIVWRLCWIETRDHNHHAVSTA